MVTDTLPGVILFSLVCFTYEYLFQNCACYLQICTCIQVFFLYGSAREVPNVVFYVLFELHYVQRFLYLVYAHMLYSQLSTFETKDLQAVASN